MTMAGKLGVARRFPEENTEDPSAEGVRDSRAGAYPARGLENYDGIQ
jgi:hypothetical protein